MNASCPLPLRDYPNILMAHGGGGRLMQNLISEVILPAFDNPFLRAQHDSAVLGCAHRRIAFTTDSFVVRPLFFPGGDIGSLAVHGTVNDLAMAGAQPAFLSAAFIIEEGLPTETLARILGSMQTAALACGVQIVTGDTKVVERCKGDGIYINTAGIGFIDHDLEIGPRKVAPGDAILLSGDIGRHGIAIMAAREGLAFETVIESDSAPVGGAVTGLLRAGIEVHCLRDITRGGLTAVLNEIATVAGNIEIDEGAVSIRSDVTAACEILGLDPFQVACEGRFVAFVPSGQADRALKILQTTDSGAGIVGEVTAGAPKVILRTALGRRILDLPAGEQLPRIC